MDAIIVTGGTAEEIAALVLTVQERQANDGANVDEIVKAVVDAQVIYKFYKFRTFHNVFWP